MSYGMKQRILKSIYHSFDAWAADLKTACQKGCATCCTQAVTMTEVEGSYIWDYICSNSRPAWLVDRVVPLELPLQGPLYTINDFALACLNGEDGESDRATLDQICPFLENNNCTIYEARPFSCRSFVSQQTCQPGSSAVIPQYYLSAAIAVSQLIEHLSQNQYWGNMLHILYTILQTNGYAQITSEAGTSKIAMSQRHLLIAKPLPGFLLSEDDRPIVKPLLNRILSTVINEKTIEQILNGK